MRKPRPQGAEIEKAGPGQVSVWDFPRPPRLEAEPREGTVSWRGVEIARSSGLLRLCETASPPTYYFPVEDVRRDLLVPSGHRTYCEWKGPSQHYDLTVDGAVLSRAAWAYIDPMAAHGDYSRLAGRIAFYAQHLDCTLGGEVVQPQPGGFYGGWLTSDIAGPVKGLPGTEHW